jgi:hypothetical protein
MATAPVLTIDCDTCVMRRTAACRDCVVTYLCEQGDTPPEFDVAEVRAVRLLSSAGLVAPLRHHAGRTGGG